MENKEDSLEVLKSRLNHITSKIIKLEDERMRISTTLHKLNVEKKEIESKIQIKNTKELSSTWITFSNESYDWSEKAQSVLESKFKLNSFRECQLAAINAVMSKKDVILLMATGGGKSLCYQLTALLLKGITLVISPLISLIEDQVCHLTQLGIPVEKLGQGLEVSLKNEIFGCLDGSKKQSFQILYVTPEFLVNSKKLMTSLQKCYDSGRLSLIAVDEVHCISEWGHDFRKDYLNLGMLRQLFETVPIMGLTATATVKVVDNAITNLNIPNAILIKKSFLRKNLMYHVEPKPENMEKYISKLMSYMKEFKDQSGIFYTATIKDANDIAYALHQKGCKVGRYHGDLTKEDRSKIYKKWLEGTYQVVVATIAFGLGIDKPDVRFIVHITMPKSLQGLYQESGRAGRDGNPSTCILWYKIDDYLKLASNSHSKIEQENSLEIFKYCLNNVTCRHAILCKQFDENYPKCETSCDNCNKKFTTKTYLIKKFANEISKVFQNDKETRFTLKKLVQAWTKLTKRKLSDGILEFIIANLIKENYLKLYFNYTPYTTNVYIRLSEQTESEDMFLVTMRENKELEKMLGGSDSSENVKRKSDKVENSGDHSRKIKKSKKSVVISSDDSN
nr:putative ATP-dependent DNA helicase Q1 [Onthophagus taurus]